MIDHFIDDSFPPVKVDLPMTVYDYIEASCGVRQARAEGNEARAEVLALEAAQLFGTTIYRLWPLLNKAQSILKMYPHEMDVGVIVAKVLR